MNGDGLSPGKETDYDLPTSDEDDATTQIVKEDERNVSIRLQSHGSQGTGIVGLIRELADLGDQSSECCLTRSSRFVKAEQLGA